MEAPEDARVIFVCVGNSCRSQMAQGLFNHLAKERDLARTAHSAGTQPEGQVSPEAIDVMSERGIDISHHTPDRVEPHQLANYDYVITMGCDDRNVCPSTFRGDARDWEIRDPKGQSIDVFRTVRDEIEHRVRELLAELT
ncbi:MAG: low molecular weight phosphatase family protein [Candidatus Bipolaricaulia bacterium]